MRRYPAPQNRSFPFLSDRGIFSSVLLLVAMIIHSATMSVFFRKPAIRLTLGAEQRAKSQAMAETMIKALLVTCCIWGIPGGAGSTGDADLIDPTRPDHFAPPEPVVTLPSPSSSPPSNEGEEQPVKPVDWKRLDLGLLLTSEGRKVAVINGHRLQEGDILESGPRIESITDDAVVVTLQGEQRTLKRHSCFSIHTTGTHRSLVLGTTCSPRGTTGAREVPLVKRGKSLFISAILNGKNSVEFLLDTGASSLFIPREIATTLVDADTIATLPLVTVKYASETRKEKSLKLDSIQVGPILINTINAVISDVNPRPLLGMAVLEKLGSWRIDNKRQVLIIDK
ncbi:MAG: retroviral-like aspartic protease family protein [Magnetococcus sp. DMHC-1]